MTVVAPRALMTVVTIEDNNTTWTNSCTCVIARSILSKHSLDKYCLYPPEVRHRQVDTERLLQRNKNLRTDLEKRQHFEFSRAQAAIKSILNNPEHSERLLAKVGVVDEGML